MDHFREEFIARRPADVAPLLRGTNLAGNFSHIFIGYIVCMI